MSLIPSPRTPMDSEGSPDDTAAREALADVADELGPIAEVVRERQRRELLDQLERDAHAVGEWVEGDPGQ